MDALLEWVGTLLLLGLLFLIVPVFFMLIVTLQFRLIDQRRMASHRTRGPGNDPGRREDAS